MCEEEKPEKMVESIRELLRNNAEELVEKKITNNQ
jgi:hypothetical protein